MIYTEPLSVSFRGIRYREPVLTVNSLGRRRRCVDCRLCMVVVGGSRRAVTPRWTELWLVRGRGRGAVGASPCNSNHHRAPTHGLAVICRRTWIRLQFGSWLLNSNRRIFPSACMCVCECVCVRARVYVCVGLLTSDHPTVRKHRWNVLL